MPQDCRGVVSCCSRETATDGVMCAPHCLYDCHSISRCCSKSTIVRAKERVC